MSDQYGSNDPNQYGGAPGQYGGGQGQYGPPPGGPQQPPNGPTGGQGPRGPLDDGAQDSKGFFGALFDFSFNHFVTPIIIKVVYALATIALVITWIVLVISGFAQNAAAGIGILILGAVGMLLYLALIRMTLEFYLAVVRMSEDIHKRLPDR